jgi:ribosomal protein S18 acetylase RimI-like enzyme
MQASGEQSVGMPASVRRLQPEDYELIRTIRLRSLTLEPAAFGSTLEREASFSDDDWRQRLAPDASPHFVTVDDAGAPTGMVVGAVDSENPQLAHLFAMWVDPHARGFGAADALVGEVKQWAAAQGCAELQLRVTEGNARAERMYQRHGFERTGQSWFRERDGLVELELVSRLQPKASAE